MTTEFDQLIDDIEAMQLAKAMSNGKGKGKAKEEEKEEEEDDDDMRYEFDEDEYDNDDGKPELKKSMVTLADGSKVPAIDGMALIKSLSGRIDGQEHAFDSQQDSLVKAIGGLSSLIKAQNTAIVALQEDVVRLRADGKGRQSVTMAKAQSPGDFMAKAINLAQTGQITPSDVAMLELVGFNQAAVPQHLANKINSL